MASQGQAHIPVATKVQLEFDELQLQRVLAQSKENAEIVSKGLQAIADAISGLMVTPETVQINEGRVLANQGG